MRTAFAAGSGILRCSAPNWLDCCAMSPSPWGTAALPTICPSSGNGLAPPTRCLPRQRSGPWLASQPLRQIPETASDGISGAAYHVRGVESFGALLAFELDRVALVQSLISVLLDGREV